MASCCSADSTGALVYGLNVGLLLQSSRLSFLLGFLSHFPPSHLFISRTPFSACSLIFFRFVSGFQPTISTRPVLSYRSHAWI
ncbi:unnamed protein product [Citrullus colocynthis]|uniref:Uncharacterized protein n=1 Tax=Citrullus colocynthis TaxID=252529 RepID=A0ABP0YTL3_9ROSI